MTITTYIATIICLVIVVYLCLALREAYRKRVYRRPFKEEWKKILQENVPLYLLLPGDLRELLHGHINYFLHNKHKDQKGENNTVDYKNIECMVF